MPKMEMSTNMAITVFVGCR